MMKRKLWLAAAAAVVAAAVTIPFVASASSADTQFQIGFSLQFTGPDTTAGIFVAAGAIGDSGSAQVTNLKVIPFGHRDEGRLSGDQTFIGHKGSIQTTFAGIVRDVSQPNQSAKGTFEITGGTGAYAGFTGRGTFVVVADVANNQIIGTEEGQAG